MDDETKEKEKRIVSQAELVKFEMVRVPWNPGFANDLRWDWFGNASIAIDGDYDHPVKYDTLYLQTEDFDEALKAAKMMMEKTLKEAGS